MAMQQTGKPLGIMLTLKILQFVRQLRRRVKPRVLEGSRAGDQLGITFAPKVRSLSRRLTLIGVRGATQSQRHAHGVRRQQKGRDSAAPANRNLAGDKVQHVLRWFDSKRRATRTAFSTLAANDKLFIKHSNARIAEACTLNETIQLLVDAHDAINVLSECRLRHGDEWLLAQGLAAGLVLDDKFVANYEHLLLRLQTELMEALARKVLEELLRGGHDKKQRKLLSWFTEFAAKPQALSTCFPWTIKPSLAVLWGVCWMFYNGAPGERALSGKDRIPLDAVLQNISLQWDTGASSDYVSLGRELIGQHTQQASLAPNVDGGPERHVFQARNTDTWASDLISNRLTSGLPAVVVSQAEPRAKPSPLPNPDTYFPPSTQDFQVPQPVNLYSPHHQGSAAPLTAFPLLGSQHHTNSWHPYPLPPQGCPRHLIAPYPGPRVRVTGAAGNTSFAQPQTDFASSNIYQPNRLPEASPLNLNPRYYNYNNNNIMTELSPKSTAPMHLPHEHKRTVSIASLTGDMPTPVSMGGPQSPQRSPTSVEHISAFTSPPRIHSRLHSRGLSIDSSQDGDDDASLRKNHSFKRAEEPPRNEDGKMICKYQECHGTSFDRKCEWSKHMDKHDRPYKCNVKGCEKLQGFTYSGGLLRHEREVHKMHGGTNKSLFCPFHDCKRSSGAGFTRKENLAEHIRRVHRRTSMSADLHGLVIRRDMLRRERDGSPIPESHVPEARFNRAMSFQQHRDDDDMLMKRKRLGSEAFSDRGDDEMRSEIKRLRHENEEKDSRLRQLEQAVMALQQSRR
ncbi:hypothetical protein P3342_005097 [Pyrenophora teres f. teres]|uniref:C2H2-type domain-containing protein n=1 Tax=Pyrenophora teres f. teres (strain 0-1) TaxID=861557 RepID=E3SAP9_PYRTT|nr:hypothetical protein PTT_20269 [Pyrenophora teres f. teres 0-1]KAK1913161.1 hypothetical protein P3342_005097 [Pyrenophora teres f. teres]